MIQIQTNKARIILVIEVVCLSRKISIRVTTKLYNISKSILSNRIADYTLCSKIKANCHKLIKIKEKIIIRYILDLDSRGFAPWFTNMKDIANYIFKLQRGKCIKKLWVY